jgi:hypothetical protein
MDPVPLGIVAIVALSTTVFFIYAVIICPILYLYYDSHISKRSNLHHVPHQKIVHDDEPFPTSRKIGEDTLLVFVLVVGALLLLLLSYLVGELILLF